MPVVVVDVVVVFRSPLFANRFPQYCICFVPMMKLVILLFLLSIFVLLLPALEPGKACSVRVPVRGSV